LIRMVPKVNQGLSDPRLDKSADTLTKRHGQLLRNFRTELVMAKPPGYSKEGNRTRFQRRIPEDVRHAFNGQEWIRIPLDFPTEREAKRSALAWYVIYEEEFAEIRYVAEFGERPVHGIFATKPLSEFTQAEMQALIKPVSEDINRSQHTAIATGATAFSELAANHAKLDTAVRDVLRGQGSEYLSVLLQLFLMTRGISYDIKHVSFTRFLFESARSHRAHAVIPNACRLKGEDVEPPPLPPMGIGLHIPMPDGLTLGSVITRYIETLPENHYKRKLALCLTLLREVAGSSLLVKDLKQTHIRDFLLTVCELPSDWGKRYKEKRIPLSELLEETDSEGLSETTYKDSYRATLTKFLNRAVRDYGDQGFPVLSADYDYTGNQRAARDKQRHLEEAELVRLFENEEFAAIAADPAQEHRYWLPVIGLYTGARPREICQLNPQCDWGKAGDVWFLTFDENTPAGNGVTKSIKTGEKRFVPLHPELVRLGLPEYLTRMKDTGADRLFPAFRLKGGNPYMVAGAEFSELLRTVGLYDNTTKGAKVTGMYVFRKTFATYGDEQDINVAPFVGHRDNDKTITERHYVTRSKEMPWLFDRFKALDFSVKVPKRHLANG
jgi:integrase